MGWIVRTSLELRFLIVGITAVLLMLGIGALPRSRLDVFPEFAPPLVEIQTECPGLDAEEVEALVTVPIESALGGVAFLSTLRSKSVPGLSSVVLWFERGTDLLVARQLVQERIARIEGELPEVADPPVILPPLSSTSRAMKIGVSSDELSLIELSTLAKWTIRPKLMAVEGVANVAIWGQRDRELQVLVDPARLGTMGVTLDEVLKATAGATQPAPGGFVDTPQQRIGISHRSPIRSVGDLEKVVVHSGEDGTLAIGDVATVREGHAPLIGEGVINDGPGLLLIVEKQPWGNTLDVTRGVEEALAHLRPGLPGVAIDSTIFRPATFIERAISNLGRALWLGCLIVVMILVLFLWEWRTALISTLAIPISLVAAILILDRFDQTINTMVLAGLIISLGELVDDAIIDVENIVRRLRLERHSKNPRSAFEVVLSSSLEVRTSIVYATLIVVLALLPVFFLEGLSGSMFRPLATAYALAVMASMAVALTVTPALALLLLGDRESESPESPITIRLKRKYRSWLPQLLDRRRALFAVSLGLVAVAALSIPFLGEGFLPSFKETDFLMHWVTKPGTSLPETRRITERASRELRAVPGVRNFGAHIGRAEVADEVVGINFTELWISIDEDVDYDQTVATIQEVVDGYPGIQRDLLTYLRERVKEVLSGTSASIVVRIYGEDLDELVVQAEHVRAQIAPIAGVSDLKVEQQVEVPQLEILPRLEALHALGLSPEDVRRAETVIVQGEKVGEIFEEQKVFDVVVRGTDEARRTVEGIGDLPVTTPANGRVRLRDVASIRVVPAQSTIKREDGTRRIDVGCNVKDGDLGTVAKKIDEKLSTMTFPLGFHAEVLGEYRARQEAERDLRDLGILALVGILFLLQASFRSWRLAALVFLALPAAMAGGVFAAIVSGGVLSLGSLVGFVTVLGIAARNGIMLVSHYQHLELEERMPFGIELVLRGAEERLAPILMTALTAGLALVPLVIAGEKPGHEIEYPMAVVIIGGLVTSTAMNLLVVPALYLIHRGAGRAGGTSRRDDLEAIDHS